jgi:flagellar basal body-associated protein FliL
MSQTATSTNAQKKRIIIICLLIGIGMMLVYAFSSILSLNLEDFLYEEVTVGNSIMPYEPDFEENIFENTKYMDLDRNIYYSESSTGVTLSIDETNYATYGGAVPFMFEYINSIINGQTNFYNDCYNDLYKQAVGKQSAFTMQKLYDIEFCILNSGTDSLSGKDYVKLWLDYKIMENNITLRNDIGSDVCRRQYITLVKEENGSYKIQAVEYENIKPVKQLILSRAIGLIAVSVIVVITAITLTVVWIKKAKKRKKPQATENQTKSQTSI